MEDSLGARIRAARQARGWSQQDLAELVGIAPHSISRIETGGRNPSVPVLAAIAKALGVGVADLIPPPPLDEPSLSDAPTELA